MWIALLFLTAISTFAFLFFIVVFWRRIDKELLFLESRIDKYNTTITLFAGFLITFLALTFNNKLPYELQLQKTEINSSQLLSAQEKTEILHKVDLASNDRVRVGVLVIVDLSLFTGLLLFGTFLPAQILQTKDNRKIYILIFLSSFYLFTLIIAPLADNLSR